MLVYLEVLFRHWRRFFVLLILLPAVIGMITIVFFPSYRASSQLWVESFADVGLGTPSGWNTYLTPSQNLSDQLTQLLTTKAFNDELYQRVVDSGYTTPVERADIANSIAGIQVTAPGSRVLALSAGCDLKPICVAVLNRLIDLFRDQQLKLQQDQADVAITFFSQQLSTAQPDLRSAQDALEKYLGQHPNLRTDPNAITDDIEYNRLVLDERDKQNKVNDYQAKLDHARFIASASDQVLQIGPKVVDPPRITRAGILGDGTSLKRAMFSVAGCYLVAGGYLFLLVVVDRTARDPRELERRLRVPVLVTIPRLDRAA